jgi:hypothetical protein
MKETEIPIYVYLHVCCINHWEEVLSRLLSDIKTSGLYEKVKKIRCVVLTATSISDELFQDPKIELVKVHRNLNLYEQATLHPLYEHAQREEFKVLYLHTKGVRHNKTNPCVLDWVDYLCHSNIQRHEECIEGLETHDTVGVNLQDEPCTHYSGNFWWAKSSYLRTLQACTYECYNSPEFWVTSGKGKFLNLGSSKVNHYNERFPPSMYL